MHLHYLTLKRQTEFLNGILPGCIIADSFTQRKNEWLIVVSNPNQWSGNLLLSSDGQFPAVLWLDQQRRGKNSTTVMAELLGKRISSIRILPFERVIKLLFDASEMALIGQFFTGRSNFFLVDENDLILNSFKAGRKHIGEKYEIARNDLLDPFDLSRDAFLAFFETDKKLPVSQVLKRVQMLTRPVIREILFRCKFDEKQLSGDISNADRALLWEQIQQFLGSCQTDPPRVYFQGEIPEKLTLTKFHHLTKLPCREFSDVNSALRYFCFQTWKNRGVLQQKKNLEAVVTRKIKSLKYHLQQVQNRPVDTAKAEYFKKIGELIVNQPHLLKTRQAQAHLIDYFDPDMPEIIVEIDPDKSPQENAELYFQKAQQQTVTATNYASKSRELKKQIDEFTKILDELKSAEQFKKINQLTEWLKTRHVLQADPSESHQYRLPYKVVCWKENIIWVGKSARDNDALTFKYAGKDDFWLHVQGYAGSHVVLRNPKRLEHAPSAALEYAARLAVTNSAAKHASYVPVIYTKVKHVRKPRKSPAGTVIPAQSKTIFVDPLKKG